MLKKLRRNKKGFTLAELLIVVAIIGVLVAISIPIFTAQLEKAREATDAANIRAAYAELSADALTETAIGSDKTEGDITLKATTGSAADGNLVYIAEIKLHQTQEGWQSDVLKDGSIGGISSGTPGKGATKATLTIHEDGTASKLEYDK